jgi:hypothetical protein
MTTAHNHAPSFGRLQASCARCQELKAGAPAVRWAMGSKQREEQRRADIRNHNCKQAKCGPVCTFGEW